jgi:hypothetical protein
MRVIGALALLCVMATSAMASPVDGEPADSPSQLVQPPAPPPPPPPAPPISVAPQALELNRLAGGKTIVPDDNTKTDIARAGRDRMISSFKLCLSPAGDVVSVDILKSSGFAAYDVKIIDTIRATWRYRPMLDAAGNPVPVCTAVTFIYTQSSTGLSLVRPREPLLHLQPGGLASSSASPTPGSPMATPGSPMATPGSPMASMDTESPPPSPPPSPLEVSEDPRPGHLLPLKPVDLSFSMGFGAMMIKPEVAAAQGIGSTGFAAGLGMELSVFDVFTLGGSVSVSSPSDSASFDEQVMPVGGGDVTTATSSLLVAAYSFELGAHTPFLVLGKHDHTAIAGALFTSLGWAGVSAERSIANCNDCEVAPLNLNGGMYIRGGAQLLVTTDAKVRGWGFTAAYQGYTGDASLSGELLFSFNLWL